MEVWKQIKCFEGFYDVSSEGRVRSYYSNSIGMSKSPKLLTLNKTRKGYRHVTLVKNKNKKYCQVHRLVAIAFIPNPENKPQINHKNGIKDDNRVENLEWVTCKENIRHAYSNGIICPIKNSLKGTKNGNSKLSKKDVIEIRSLGNEKGIDAKFIAESFNVSVNHIYNILKYKSWAHI